MAYRKEVPLQVRVWPVPTEVATITWQITKMMGDTNDTTKTLEMGRHWYEYVVMQLAHDLALSAGLPVQRLGYMKSLAKDYLTKAKQYSSEGVPFNAIHSHRSGYTGGGPWRHR